MKSMQNIFIVFFLTLSVCALQAQIAEEIITESTIDGGDPNQIIQQDASSITPVNGVTPNNLMENRMVLEYPHIREADVFWSKYIWGIIDVREKINQPFTYPGAPFFGLLIEGIQSGAIQPYMGDSDDFEVPMDAQSVNDILFSQDTVMVTNPETFEVEPQIVRDDIDYSTIKKYRTKEIWFFDKLHSRMRVRILGICPIKDKVGEEGTFAFEYPLFWIYWPQARKYFSTKKVFLPGNAATILSWDDYLEMRYFNYYVIKESNVRDYRLSDFPSMQGDSREAQLRRMLESKKIKEDIFNYESDLWSY